MRKIFLGLFSKEYTILRKDAERNPFAKNSFFLFYGYEKI